MASTLHSNARPVSTSPAPIEHHHREEDGSMSKALDVELFRDDSQNFRSIRLEVKEDGSVRIDAHDMGSIVEEMWGDSDYEFWVEVKSTELPKLVFALIQDKYKGSHSAVTDFSDFCKTNNVEYNWDSWA